MIRFLQKWSDCLFWLVCNFAGVVLPVAIGLIVLIAFKYDVTIGAITNGGQFAIYSVAMLVTTVYILGKDSSKLLKHARWFALAMLVLWVFSVLFFVLAVLYQTGSDISDWITEWPTIGIFVISLVVAFFAIVADKRRELDRSKFEEITKSRMKKLSDRFGRTSQD